MLPFPLLHSFLLTEKVMTISSKMFSFCVLKFSTVNELNKLQNLEQLKFNDNAIVECEKNAKTVRQLIIAKLGGLKVLNRTEVSAFT